MPNNEPPSRLDGPGSRPWRASETCWGCAHQRPGKTCTAFPNGIPDELYNAYRGHRTPYPGDNGIQYTGYEGPEWTAEIPDFLRMKPAVP